MSRKKRQPKPLLKPGFWVRGEGISHDQAVELEKRSRAGTATPEELLALFWHNNP